MMLRPEKSLIEPVAFGLADTLWSVFNDTRAGPVGEMKAQDICYNAKWLGDQKSVLRSHWCQMHRLLATLPHQRRFRALLCLSTMAYAETGQIQILQILVTLYRNLTVRNTIIPSADCFMVHEGRTAVQSEIQAIAQQHSFGFIQSKEYRWPQKIHEDEDEYYYRRYSAFSINKSDALKRFAAAVHSQWVCDASNLVIKEEEYLDTFRATPELRAKWTLWYQNHCFYRYLVEIAAGLELCMVTEAPTFGPRLARPRTALPKACQPRTSKPYLDGDSFFTHADFVLPTVEKQELKLCRLTAVSLSTHNTLAELLKRLKTVAVSHYPSAEKYVSELEKSLEALKRRPGPSELSHPRPELDPILQVYLNECRTNVDNIYSALQNIFQENLIKNFTQNLVSADNCKTAATFMAPHMSASILLGNLTRQQWQRLSLPWQRAIVLYGIALTDVQQAERLLQMNVTTDLVKELSNTGHTNWNPLDHPESLLLEIESGILIREVQEHIAKHMREPPKGENAIMQLNMGEGKSSVIVPIVAAHLADGSRLVRVIVAKPQAKELLRTLSTKLGGLLNHRIYHMPFNRSLRLAAYQVHALSEQYKECREQRGVLLCHPEHILSFKLMAIEYQSLEGRMETGNALLDLYHDFNLHTRDIVDESDENLSPRFELIYTMGVQRPIELSPDRWVLLQRVLGVVASIAISIQKHEPESMEVTHDRLGYFPRTRVLRDEAGSLLLRKVTQRVCDTGLPGLPIARQDSKMRQAIFDYIFEDDLSQDQINAVENTPFFTDTIKGPLLILRGLIAGRVLLFALKQKRWRVDYGLDVNRTPSTRLAVPYRAKDSPSLRSEFSHPDVVILLTCLSYYYHGLSDEEMFIAFAHLMRADQAEIDYNEWVSDAPDLPASFQQLGGINLKDISQVTTRVFPHIRHAKRAVDYFLSHFVFPKEMKEFSHKLSASGWDLGQQKRNATTGFSGTNDSRHVLPLEVKQLEIEEHLHTNALVLGNLLRPENKVQLLGQGESSPVDRLFDFVADTENDVHVILDVGAQVLELTNVQVARRWLQLLPAEHKQEAVVYFNDDDDLCVIDREGTSEQLWISPYSDQLDRCLVFLDQAHTRGTDLKLPEYYRAAVTLGPDLIKDGLVQACMRMRKLGSGQSVVFCVSQEMQFRVNKAAGISPGSDIAVSDVLIWAIHETHANLHRVMPLWASQGVRFERQKKIWKSATKTDGIKMVPGQAEEFLEEEAKTIECRYRPSVHNSAIELQSLLGKLGLDECEEIAAIQARCDDFGVSQSSATALQEEQEKELAPEIEQERQIERPPRAEPALHSIHKELVEFVTTGHITSNSSAILPAFSALAGTRVANSSNLVQFPCALLATADYASTVKLSKRQKQIEGAADAFQRPIQWILTGCGTTGCTNAVIISPHEAQELLPLVAQSKSTHLHIYAPRSSMTLAPMDALRLYTVPKIPPGWRLPDNLRLELNLFAGQLYFSSFDDYRRTCNMLSLAWRPPMAGGVMVEADGFIAAGVAMNSDMEELRETTGEVENWAKFDRSPVKSLKTLLTVLRRDCSEIDKTHWGRIIAGELLTEEDFTTDYGQV
ncbi:hypothetical protein NQ176_g6980 [Zarea fungicola]|uniref:Uncharacterized protein n=1 Tax=Zarea fungicola TaxID=93591 RepID=A0ACC1N292_9HYPO|nr:hypothetical protein NQ176_g6980 [Lecanicillium fungicola]